MNLFNRIDAMLIRRYPNLWILGIHIFIPIAIIASVVLFILGYISAGNMSEMIDGNRGNFFLNMMLLVSLPVIFVFIWYFIRQIRYNSARIHHSLPFKRGVGYFFAFFLMLLSIISVPVMPLMGNYFKARVLTSELRSVQEYSDAKSNRFERYFGKSYQDLEGAEKYSESEKNLAKEVYYLEDQFFVASFDFWRNFSLSALFFAMILFSVCATNTREFGWAMLYCAVFPIIYGILNLLINLASDFKDDVASVSMGLLSVMIVLLGLGAFVKGLVKESTSRSLSIMLYLFSPYFVITYVMLLNVKNWNYTVPVIFATSIICTVIFNQVFKRKYVNPI